MELRHLVSFIALAEELHFGRAAAKVHVSQPALSTQVQKLEKSLGVQLVVRTPQHVTLTAAGSAFEEHARIVVADVDRAASVARDTASGRRGSVRVGYNFPASLSVLPGTLSRMRERAPDVVVSLWERRSGPQLDDLTNGRLDVALVYGHPRADAFRYTPVLPEVPLVAVVGQEHAWAGEDSVRFAELAGQHCVMFAREQSPAMYDSIFRAAYRSKISLRVARSVDDAGATAHLVSTRSLVAFASEHRARADGLSAMGTTAVAVGLLDPTPTIDLCVVWRAGEHNPAVETFVDCITSSPI